MTKQNLFSPLSQMATSGQDELMKRAQKHWEMVRSLRIDESNIDSRVLAALLVFDEEFQRRLIVTPADITRFVNLVAAAAVKFQGLCQIDPRAMKLARMMNETYIYADRPEHPVF